MINADMREYDYYLYGDADAYGQPTLSEDVKGTVKIAIYNTSKATNDSITYTAEDYIGLTNDNGINDTYVIQYDNIKLKVLYTIKAPRNKLQVFMEKI